MNEEVEILNRILKKESPLLFLRAGFSIGAKLLNTRDFPKGDELKLLLMR